MRTTIANGTFDASIRLVKRILPKNYLGDRATSFLTFVQYNGRLPKTRHGELNDALYAIKTTGEIRNPLRVFVSDKEYLKVFVKATVGDKYNVPTTGVLSSHEEAVLYQYPENCVIKPTHMSGEVMFRRDGNPIDFEKIDLWLRTNYYNWTREANYKSLKPKIIVEPYIFGENGPEDYKIFCVNGVPRIMWVDGGRETDPWRNIYTPDWEPLPASILHPRGEALPKPDNLEEMLEVAAKLSKDFSLIRVDLYSNGKTVLVGELTNCSGDARSRVEPKKYRPEFTELLFGKGGFNAG